MLQHTLFFYFLCNIHRLLTNGISSPCRISTVMVLSRDNNFTSLIVSNLINIMPSISNLQVKLLYVPK